MATTQSVQELCATLKERISEHSLACSNLFGSLCEGHEVDKRLEGIAEAALKNVNQTAAELILLLDQDTKDCIREVLDVLRNHYDEWEIKNESGRNPVSDLVDFDSGEGDFLNSIF